MKPYFEIIAAISSLIAIAVAAIALRKFLESVSTKRRVQEIGNSFQGIVKSLATGTESEQLIAAVLIRRFFSTNSEFGLGVDLPYSRDSVNVIAVMLKRNDISENLRKTLADGLREAPNLREIDFQMADFGNVFLGLKAEKRIDISDSDFSYAKIQGSMRGATGSRTVFRKINVVKQLSFETAKFFSVNFDQSELVKVNFQKSHIEQSSFKQTRVIKGDFRGSHFTHCDFSSAYFNECDFSDANFSDCDLSSSIFLEGTFKNARFLRCRLQNSSINSENFPIDAFFDDLCIFGSL